MFAYQRTCLNSLPLDLKDKGEQFVDPPWDYKWEYSEGTW